MVGVIGSTLGPRPRGAARPRAARRCSACRARPAPASRSIIAPRDGRSRRTSWAWSSRWSRPGCPPAGRPGSRRSRRCATTSRCPSRPCAAGSARRTRAARRRACRWSSGCSRATCRTPAGVVGVGVLLVLLGAALRARWPAGRYQPVCGPRRTRATLRNRGPAGRPELPAQPAAYAATASRADDRAGPGLHDVGPRHVGQGLVDKSVEENFIGDYIVEQRVRRGLLAADRRPDPRGRRGRRCCGSASAPADIDGAVDGPRGGATPTTIVEASTCDVS